MATINVFDYGARQDNGGTDNTPLFQSALNDCEASGGGKVVAQAGGFWRRFGFGGGLAIPAGVQLTGEVEGPADQELWGTILEVHSTSSPFLSDPGKDLGGSAVISDLAFWYPNQSNGSTDPVPYPPTISFSSLVKVKRNYFHNAFSAMVLNAGRSEVTRNNIGCFNVALQADSSYDVLRVSGNHVWPFYNAGAYPSEADNWAASHGVGFNFLRCDDVQMADNYIFGKWVGVGLSDSPSPQPGGLRASCGMSVNLGTDACQHGIFAGSTQGDGWNFHNYNNAASAPPAVNGGKAVAAVTFPGGGSSQPIVQVLGGWEGGFYSGGPVYVVGSAPHYFRATNWLGYN